MEIVEDGASEVPNLSEMLTESFPDVADARRQGHNHEKLSQEGSHHRPGPYHRGHGNWTGRRIARSVNKGLNELQVFFLF